MGAPVDLRVDTNQPTRRDILDAIQAQTKVLKSIDERQDRDWKQHLRAKRRQVLVGIVLAIAATATLYLDIIRIEDFSIHAERARLAIEAMQRVL